MIKVKKYIGNIKGKKKIENLIPWQNDNVGYELSDEEKRTINIFKYRKMKNTSFKITCDSNCYLKIPYFDNTYYTVVSDDNYTKGELTIITKDLNEIYIPINENEINFDKNSSIFRPYIIDEITNNENIIKRYLVVVSIQYKDNGKINNENFDFDYSIRINKVFERNITYGLLNYAFYGYFLWVILNIFMKRNFLELINNPTTITVLITYLISTLVKTIHIGNTFLNKILVFFKIKEKNYCTNRELKKIFKKYKKTCKK